MGAAARDLRRLVAQGGPKLTRAALPAKQFVSIHTSIKRCRGFFSAPPRAARERWKFCLVRLRVLELTTAHQRPFQDDIAVKPPGACFGKRRFGARRRRRSPKKGERVKESKSYKIIIVRIARVVRQCPRGPNLLLAMAPPGPPPLPLHYLGSTYGAIMCLLSGEWHPSTGPRLPGRALIPHSGRGAAPVYRSRQQRG